ncbi:hypothetical protein RSOLAG1IB_08004 [Rhizoctonia solani AG-1 IB]|uniref:Uncharacterized protein n=1 Tax=Thanatephorus cucumeris (strain AG1-IB / isolate 7/3/14) TaxID=1108050 RepID=A0A0B7FKC8_THACB|nr:hypothetical protein RSOLAG1IB_08004 [Rhizoctonia solani AG-1 IB]
MLALKCTTTFDKYKFSQVQSEDQQIVMSRKPGGTTSLSNGTLSLRFMQRGAAQRVTATTAKVVDEAEWDIGPAARAAWGVTSSTNPNSATGISSIHVTRDDSYLPFVFDRGTPDTTDLHVSGDEEAEPGRRRMFREGTEVTQKEVSPVETTNSSNEADKIGTKADSDTKATGSSKLVNPQPKSISSPPKTNDAQVTNKPGIRRHRLEGLLKRSEAPYSGFLKPAGVSSASSTSAKRTHEGNTAPRRGKVMRTE